MFNQDLRSQMLVSRRIFQEQPNEYVAKAKVAYYNAYLLANFGVVVDKPSELKPSMVEAVAQLYRKTVPASFFKNPQDMKYYTKDELFIEQVLSYFLAYGEENSHVEVFKKDLPEYCEGDELKLRTFRILTAEEVKAELDAIMSAYCAYKRPWSSDEELEVRYLYNMNHYKDYEVACGDNAFFMYKFSEKPIFATFLYKKDLVKLSIDSCGEQKSGLALDTKTKALIKAALPLVKDCPMSKKQAKYFNKLVSLCKVKVKPTTNEHSIDRLAQQALANGDVVGAAKIYARSGAALTRHIKMLLSRANIEQQSEILDMLGTGTPLATYQVISTLSEDLATPRTFTFTKNKRVKRHVETDYETKWRKSRLTSGQIDSLVSTGLERIIASYQTMPTLGKVYVADNFYKIAPPVNTSASGKGIDVVPIGSRLPINGKYIRTFVHWEDAFDIDASLILIKKDGSKDYIDFSNYRYNKYNNAVLFSGDVTSPTGTEYYDLDLDSLKKQGVTRVLQTFHGYCSSLNSGTIYCGYQNKENLKTKAWDAKNIELKIHVHGDSRAFMSFGLDLETNEVVVFNQMLESDSRVVSPEYAKVLDKYFNRNALALNMGVIASARAEECVLTPEEADLVFSDVYAPVEGQKVIRSFDIEKLAAIATGV